MPIDSVTSLSPDPWADASGLSKLPSKSLNQQDFLKLLVAQLSSQDPMNPQSNADFAAQMAQFSALQTSQDTRAEIAQLRSDQQVGQASSLLGRVVTLQTAGAVIRGVVGSIHLVEGRPQLLVNGSLYDPSQVLTIQPIAPDSAH